MPPLTITITSPTDGTTFNEETPITVTGTVTNSASVTVNGVVATVSTDTFTASVTLSEGENVITATATDTYGQTATDSITVSLITKGTITGTVIDTSTSTPIPSAEISIIDSLNITLTGATDAEGNYSIANVTQGAYTGTITLRITALTASAAP